MAFEKLKKKFFAKKQAGDAEIMGKYTALVVEALDGDALGDDAKTVNRVCGVLEDAGRTWATFEDDIEALRQQRQLEALCADEEKHCKALSEARSRKRKLDEEWAAAMKAHTEVLRVVEGEIGSSQAQMSVINQAKATLKSD